MTTPPADRTPTMSLHAFDCPTCAAYAAQKWAGVYTQGSGHGMTQHEDLFMSTCMHCRARAIWFEESMIFPLVGVGPQAHPDMPQDVRAIYNEASEVSAISRKSAAALLRLALQMLVDELEPGNGNINEKIGALVKVGLDPQVQQAMDVVRVVGNNAVHPGQIDLDADDGLLPALFSLVNLIVEQVVTRPKAVAALYGSLPAGVQAAVARRDGTTP